jgi:hypothetical protein
VLPAGEIVALDEVVTVIPFAVAVGDAAVVQVPVCPANECWPTNSSAKTHTNASLAKSVPDAISRFPAPILAPDFGPDVIKLDIGNKESDSRAHLCHATNRRSVATLTMVDLDCGTRNFPELSTPKSWVERARSLGEC